MEIFWDNPNILKTDINIWKSYEDLKGKTKSTLELVTKPPQWK